MKGQDTCEVSAYWLVSKLSVLLFMLQHPNEFPMSPEMREEVEAFISGLMAASGRSLPA